MILNRRFLINGNLFRLNSVDACTKRRFLSLAAFRWLKVLVLVLVCAFSAHAGRLQYSKYQKGPNIVTSLIKVQDDYWTQIYNNTESSIFEDKVVRNYIKLFYTGQNNIIYKCNQSFSVTAICDYK